MNKSTYMKPVTTVLSVKVAEMLAVSSVEYTTEEVANDEYEALSNKRRGSWDNLWSKEF